LTIEQTEVAGNELVWDSHLIATNRYHHTPASWEAMGVKEDDMANRLIFDVAWNIKGIGGGNCSYKQADEE